MKRGFGSPNYNRERARQVHQMGARALREQGKSHKWTPGPEGTASTAGQKGGEKRAARIEQQQEKQAA